MEKNLVELEEEFFCPISQEVMKDPVILIQTNQIYERRCIQQWLVKHNTCPMTNVKLSSKEYIPVPLLKKIINKIIETMPYYQQESIKVNSIKDLSERFKALEKSNYETIKDIDEQFFDYININEKNFKSRENELLDKIKSLEEHFSKCKCKNNNIKDNNEVYNINEININNFDNNLQELKEIEKNNKKEIEEMYSKAEYLMNKGYRGDSVLCYSKIYSLTPNDSRINYILGDICQDESNLKKALEYYRTANLNSDNILDPYYKLGTLLKNYTIDESNKKEEIAEMNECFEIAKKRNQKAFEFFPNDYRNYMNRSYILYYTNDSNDKMIYQEALKNIDKAIALKKGYVELLNFKGKILSFLNKNKEALNCYNASLSINKYNSNTFLLKGMILSIEKDTYKQSIECFDEAINLNEKNFEAYKHKGEVLYNMDKYKEALECLEKSIILNPHDSITYFYKANVLISLDRINEALSFYDKSISIYPNNHQVYYNKGVLLKQMNRDFEANKCFEICRKIESKNIIID